jgi:hypothetical protein
MNPNTPIPQHAWKCWKCGRAHPLTLKRCPYPTPAPKFGLSAAELDGIARHWGKG